MGLDIYFYRRQSDIPKKGNLESIVSSFNNSERMQKALEKLGNYLPNQMTLDECLDLAIQQYIDDVNTKTEVGYFRKFYYLLDYFNYTSNDYAQDKIITEEAISALRDVAKKTLMMVEKDLTDNGWIIQQSPLSSDVDEVVLKNGIFTQEMEERADLICEKVFDDHSSFLYQKCIELYKYFTKILAETDFQKQEIVMNADW